MEFKELVKSRRSAINFLSNIDITKEQLDQIFEVTKNYPSCFNLQHAHYYVIIDRNNRDGVRNASGQHKTLTASACILVCGDKDAYKKASQIYGGLKMLKMIDELEYEQTIDTINTMYISGGQRFTEDEAIRNSILSAMIFMLAAKDEDWDTCPMIGFDTNKMAKAFNVSDNHVPTLLITLGKSDETKMRPRGYRKPVSEFVHYQ